MILTDILAKLFGSINRVKIIRFFLLNPEEFFTTRNICRRLKISKQSVRKETSLLKIIGLIKQRSEFISTESPKSRRRKKKRISGWRFNDSFPFLANFKDFLLDSESLSKDQLLRKIQRAGRIKLVILSGLLCETGKNARDASNPNCVDILLVGDGIRKPALEKAIQEIETEIGKEITYAVFNTQDFSNRFGMYDRFIRDILDYPHEKILDKIGI